VWTASFASTKTVGAAVLVGSPVGRKKRADAPPATVPLPPFGPFGPLGPLVPFDEPFELVVQAASEAERSKGAIQNMRVITMSSSGGSDEVPDSKIQGGASAEFVTTDAGEIDPVAVARHHASRFERVPQKRGPGRVTRSGDSSLFVTRTDDTEIPAVRGVL
jgi:hypothetical protein